MELERTEIDGITIFELSGKIMGGPDAMMMNDQLHQVLESGHNKIIADLSSVEWMNSSGLGILIQAATLLKNNQGRLKLANVSERIQNLLKITKLSGIFETSGSIEEAVTSLNN